MLDKSAKPASDEANRADGDAKRMAAELDRAITEVCGIVPTSGVAQGVGLDLASELVQRQLATGGKRLRGLLPIAIVAAEAGPTDAARRFGAAVEAIHNGTLVHDDIQDRDTLRRGQPTLWVQTGVPQAINSGDLLLVAPIAAVLEDRSLAPELAVSLGRLLAGALLETIRGQVADVGLRDDVMVSREQLESIACAKTSPLFACALQGAALLLHAGPERIESARLCGHRLGLAFQIRDDLLDALGTKGRGVAGADLREGKPTWPLLAACEGAPDDEVEELRLLLRDAASGSPPNAHQTAHWIAWTSARGGISAARHALSTALEQARLKGAQAFPKAQHVIAALCERLAIADG